jgi:hypothetical protein
MKLARRLKDKLARNPPYWQVSGMEGLPFVFGVRHKLRGDGIHIEWTEEQLWGNPRNRRS